MTKKKAPTASATNPPDPKALRVDLINGKTPERAFADLATEGVLTNAALLTSFGKNITGEIAITEAVQSMRAAVAKVARSDLGAAEGLLMSQAIALNAMFAELARRSGLNLGEHLDATDRYMRLALKAQGQCRAKLETLAAIKNPPVVFARQANINNGGQQQVNNGLPHTSPERTPAHTANSEFGHTGLLEGFHGERMDSRASSTTGGTDPHMETVGAVNRTANR